MKRNPEERELAVELGRAFMATKEWRRSIEVLDGALKDLPVAWGDLRDWAACAELLASALRSEGIEKERPLELLQIARDINGGRVRPTPTALASKISAAVDEAWTGDKIPELPAYEERSGGLPKFRLGNRSPGDIQFFISGPISLTATVKASTGKDPKPTELDLVPGVYRIAAVITEKTGKPKKLYREQRVGPGAVIAFAFDGAHALYKP